MSKKVKALLERDIKVKVGEVDGVAVISPQGLPGKKNNALRGRLHAKGLRMVVVKNTLARRALNVGALKGFDSLLDGPSALIHGKTSVSALARLLLEEQKADDKLQIRGLFYDGEIYEGLKGVEQASKLPTRDEAIANLVASILSPGRKLGGILKGQASIVASILKTVEDRAKEKEGAAEPAAAPTA